ncbi:Interleukin-4 receptor subunit alpha [Boothiomyces macroporosus]|uniref:GTP-binding protein n=1 Tax=Boothiomyces macroporosus TaxID=261099 RepID=A0AAD5URK6_9FUNG|nr:Interleukin-4 receptor subunit alpha [Boothiomyces macroporosus]
MKRKVLLMGKSGSGKTSMRSIIFANYIAKDTRRLGATIDVEYSNVRLLGKLALNLWDCGGQDGFMDSYLTSQREQVFRNVEVLIYVFDVESRDEKDLIYYQSIIDGMREGSKDAQVTIKLMLIFCLIHKMDLIQQDKREKIFNMRCKDLAERSYPFKPIVFATSIWDETLYKAWSSIVYSLIPNVQHLESSLEKFRVQCEASEVILFEKATFLVIAHTKESNNPDIHRFEKVSNIIKQFKLSCSKSQAHFQTMELRNNQMSLFIQPLTSNTYILVVLSDPNIRIILTNIESSIPILNIQAAKNHFEKIEFE